MNSLDKKINVGVISLGCDKNLVDTENMLYYIAEGGLGITNDIDTADVVIINTCAFIDSSKKESIDTILEVAKQKKTRPLKIIVTGCLPQRFKGEIEELLSEVDAFLGIDSYKNVVDVIKKTLDGERTANYDNGDGVRTGRILATPMHYAYLKIADGCDNHCTYCAIPKIRGKFRSRTIESLVDEAKMLIDEYGVKELNIVAQDITRYGVDIYNKYALIDLLEQLDKLNVSWIRLLYCYPELLSDDLIKVIAEGNKVCKYVDIPLQHVDDGILKLMGRRTTEAEIKTLIEKIRAANDTIAIRSTFIAGFPTETEEQFKKLYDFVADYRLNYAGFFAYSKEDGTAAAKLGGQIPASVKQARKRELEILQSAIIAENQAELIGSTQKVLYEGIDFDKQLFYGRTEFNAPNVDTKVYFKSKNSVDVGNFYTVKIKKIKKLDLIGESK